MSKDKHIPQGYKDSSLGIIPKEWEVKRLGDIGSFKNGLNFSPIENGIFYYFLGVGDFQNKNIIDSKCLGKICLKERLDNSYLLEDQDLVFVRSNGSKSLVGRCVLINTNQKETTYSGFCIRFRIDDKCTTTQYILHLIDVGYLKRFLVYEGRGTNITNLNQGILGRLSFPVPPIEEQNRILTFISVWDTAIEKQSELIEKLTLRKRALMQQLLTGKKRLAGFNGKWKHVPIKTFAKEISNKNIGGDNHIVLSCTKYDGLVPSLEYFGKQIYSNDLSSYKIIPIGHFAYATNHIEEGSIGYQSRYEYGLISPMYTVFITDKTKVNDTFLFAVLKSHHLVYLYKSMMEGSINRRGGLRWNSFSTIKIDLPPLAEQNAIASVLVKADKEIELAKGKLASLQSQKRGLMQQLLTGKKRIK